MTPEETIEALSVRVHALEQHAIESTKVAQRLVTCVERLQQENAALVTAVSAHLKGGEP